MLDLTTLLAGATKLPAALKKIGQAEMADTVFSLLAGVNVQMTENLGLRGELKEKGEELKKLKDITELKKKLEFKNDCYWDEAGHPICSACLEKAVDPAPIRLHSNGRNDGFVICPICNISTYSKGQSHYDRVVENADFDPHEAI